MSQAPTRSAFGRLLRLGGLATRVGTSLATEQVLGFLFSGPIAQARRTENFVLNAFRVTQALGELKGAAMKVGQMLSVHEGLLPPEVCAVLQGLQRDAPPVSFERMQAVLEAELPGGLAQFRELERTPLAAASIGQVYRGRLVDGRAVAVKVQYPDIDRIVAADLKNLKQLFGSLLATLADVDVEPLWAELRDRLLEELDYRQEAANIARMGALHAKDPDVLIPAVIPEASSQRVLSLEYVPGISPESACSGSYPQDLRDRWGAVLLRFVMDGLIEHRFLHADPNFGNFAFREDGRLVVYDHGCVKQVPPAIADGCAGLLRACLDQDLGILPDRLHALGVYDRRTGAIVPRRVTDPLAREVLRILGPEAYRFSRDSTLYDTLLDRNGQYLAELTRLELPPDLMFVNRTLSGIFGNLCRLEASGHWRELLAPFAAATPIASRA
ncbi:MAG: AarF/ABC1/UbiB kinase family protein [Pseudomonadales bacterium]|nr:AarF/ABC1/UbiB kinase family protein [Pseudomonadales bacterium]